MQWAPYDRLEQAQPICWVRLKRYQPWKQRFLDPTAYCNECPPASLHSVPVHIEHRSSSGPPGSLTLTYLELESALEMGSMDRAELRPMGIGDILDAAFRLYRAHFGTYLTIALVVYVPYGALMGAFQTFVHANALQNLPRRKPTFQTVAVSTVPQNLPQNEMGVLSDRDLVLTAIGSNQPLGPTLWAQALVPLFIVAVIVGAIVGLMMMMILAICQGALLHNISAGYLGESLGAWESYTRAAPQLLRLIGANVRVSVRCMLGFICLIVPGVIFALWFMLVAPVVMLEKRAGSAALGRSRELMRGNLRKGFLLALVVMVLTIIISLGLGFVLSWISWPHPFLENFSTQIVQVLVLPIQTAPVILLYYDLRIRKEAFDIERLAAELATPGAV